MSLESQLREAQRDGDSQRLDCETYQMKIQALDEQVSKLTARVDKQRERELEEEKRLVELELEKERGRLAGEKGAQSLGKKATIRQLTTMLSTSKNGLFPGPNHLLTTGADDPTF